MSYAERRDGKLTGKWVGEVNSGRGRWRRVFPTKSEADGYEAYVKATGQEPATAEGKRFSGVTFREVAELCSSAGGPRRGKWKAGKDASVRQRLAFVVDVLGDLDIQAVGTPDLDKLVATLQKRPGYKDKALSPATINRYLTAASAVLTFATQRGYRDGKPVIPLQEETGAREAVVSPELEDALMRHMRSEGHHAEALCCQVLIETGLRAGELQALTSEQIENEWIKLRARQTKTNTAREVWIDPDLARDFRALVASGGRPDRWHLLRIFRSAVEACGGNPELVLHSLRHTRATRLLESGVDPQITMEMMGWTSFNTMRRYRHVQSYMHVEAAKKVALRRGGNPENGSVVPFASKKIA